MYGTVLECGRTDWRFCLVLWFFTFFFCKYFGCRHCSIVHFVLVFNYSLVLVFPHKF